MYRSRHYARCRSLKGFPAVTCRLATLALVP